MEHISKSGSVLKSTVYDFIDYYDAAHLLDRQTYVTSGEIPKLMNSVIGWILKIIDFRITPALLGIILVLALALTYMAPSRLLSYKTSERIRRWAISTIPVFFTGLIFQLVCSLALLIWGGFELYFSFSFLWFGANILHVAVPILSFFLAVILWYVLKRNYYVVYYKADVYSWTIIRYFLFPSIFVFQQARNIHSHLLWIPVLRNVVQWILSLPVISIVGNIITTPPYISVIAGFDSFIFRFLMTLAINIILPILIKRTIKFVYRSFEIKIEEYPTRKSIRRRKIGSYYDYI